MKTDELIEKETNGENTTAEETAAAASEKTNNTSVEESANTAEEKTENTTVEEKSDPTDEEEEDEASETEESKVSKKEKLSKGGKTKKRKISVFYAVYFSLIVLFVLALTASVFIIRNKLASYEKSRPEKYFEKIYEEYFGKGCEKKLIEKADFEISDFTTTEELEKYVGTFLDEGTEYYSVASKKENVKQYAIKSGDLKIASLSIAPNGEKDEAGYDVYELSELRLLIGGSEAVSISAPKSDRVFVNGIELGSEYIVGEPIPDPLNEHLPEGTEGIFTVTYEVKGVIGDTEVTATDPYGGSVEGIVTEDGVFYTVPVTYAPLYPGIESAALAAGESYAAYMQADAPFYSIGQYVDPYSDLYFELRTSDTRWVNEHNGYSIESPSVSEYYVYSNDIYSCRVKFTHVLHNWGGDYFNDFDMTFFYKLINGVYFIYDSRVN